MTNAYKFMQAFNSIDRTKKQLVNLVALVGLVCAETLVILTSAHATTPHAKIVSSNSMQENYALGTYRCADDDGTNVQTVKVNATDDPVYYTISVQVTEDLTMDLKGKETSGEEDNNHSYRFYDPKSNWTLDFLDYGNGKGRLIGSLENSDGQQKQQYNRKCYSIGIRNTNPNFQSLLNQVKK